jgi:hypothetical protein
MSFSFFKFTEVSRQSGAPVPAELPTPMTNHTPLCEGNKFIYQRRVTEMPGVLGRIPSHSIRAPRPLLELKTQSLAGNVPVDPNNPDAEQSEGKKRKVLLYQRK